MLKKSDALSSWGTSQGVAQHAACNEGTATGKAVFFVTTGSPVLK